jgi:hypothetical protein
VLVCTKRAVGFITEARTIFAEMEEKDRESGPDEGESDEPGLLYRATRAVVEAAELIVGFF